MSQSRYGFCRKKLTFCFIILLVLGALSSFRIVWLENAIIQLHTVNDFSKPPPLPDWSSITVKHFYKDRSQINERHSYNMSFPLSVETAYSLRWIVVTSIHHPNNVVEKLSKLKGWSLVLVADVSTPQNWSYPNCVFLSIERQKALLFETLNIIPYRNYGRKTIGYLYAIQHGARIIYETDDDNELISGIEEQVLGLKNAPTSKYAYFLPADIQQINTFVSKPFFDARVSDTYANTTSPHSSTREEQITTNPYHYFGQNTLWPRGYPLRLIGDDIPMMMNLSTVRPLIQQGLANGDPDMDAIFRLTRSNRHKRINIRFEERPPVAISHGLLVPFNSQNTLFHYDAFWALWIPITTTFRVCDIWRGYFVQRLLWELEPQAALTFHSASVFQMRNSHNYLRDFEDELQLYIQAEQLILFLRNWTCSQGGSHLKDHRDCGIFFNKIFFLAVDMVEAGFWEMKDAWLCRAFLIDLIKHGYKYDLEHRTSAIDPETANQHIKSIAQKLHVSNKFGEKWTRTLRVRNNPAVNSDIDHVISNSYYTPTRVAVCVSGQIRTLNMVVPSILPVMIVDRMVYENESAWQRFTLANQTTATNIRKMLFDRLPAFDVFMYVSTKEKHPREPQVNDSSVCESLRPGFSGNRLFCSVVREVDIVSPSTNLTVFNNYSYSWSKELRQGLLQQLNGLLQCNAMRKEYSRQSGTQYTHWIRLRPDTVFLEPFPDIEKMRFVSETTRQPIVTFANKSKCCCGNEDWFGVGAIQTMDAYFDRINVLKTFTHGPRWTAEDFATYAVKQYTNAQLIDNNSMIQACLYKPPDRKAPGDP